jgi:hypothetical protein
MGAYNIYADLPDLVDYESDTEVEYLSELCSNCHLLVNYDLPDGHCDACKYQCIICDMYVSYQLHNNRCDYCIFNRISYV